MFSKVIHWPVVCRSTKRKQMNGLYYIWFGEWYMTEWGQAVMRKMFHIHAATSVSSSVNRARGLAQLYGFCWIWNTIQRMVAVCCMQQTIQILFPSKSFRFNLIKYENMHKMNLVFNHFCVCPMVTVDPRVQQRSSTIRDCIILFIRSKCIWTKFPFSSSFQ